MAQSKMFIILNDEQMYGTETRYQETNEDLDSTSGCREQLEGGHKNQNRTPDLPKHNSSSLTFDIQVPVNPKPEL
jgi:hypothetical protein